MTVTTIAMPGMVLSGVLIFNLLNDSLREVLLSAFYRQTTEAKLSDRE